MVELYWNSSRALWIIWCWKKTRKHAHSIAFCPLWQPSQLYPCLELNFNHALLQLRPAKPSLAILRALYCFKRRFCCTGWRRVVASRRFSLFPILYLEIRTRMEVPPPQCVLTLILLTWRIWWDLINARKWQMGFDSAFNP